MAEIRRGEVWWANLAEPRGSEPGFRGPVVVIQADSFNDTRLATILVVAVSSNLTWASARGNVLLKGEESGLPKDSVVNVTQVITLDRRSFSECVGELPPPTMNRIADGLRLVMGL